MRHRGYCSKPQLFRYGIWINDAPPEQHPPEQMVFADQLVKKRGQHCHRQWETDPSGTLNLTHRFRWFLREGGADAEAGGADGIGCFEEARG
jgi:hypothetical protein